MWGKCRRSVASEQAISLNWEAQASIIAEAMDATVHELQCRSGLGSRYS